MVLLGALLAARTSAATFDLPTATIADIQAAVDAGALTYERLIRLYLARIARTTTRGRHRTPGVTVKGLHCIHEDSPHEIGSAFAQFLRIRFDTELKHR
jgi:hypothetical protein